MFFGCSTHFFTSPCDDFQNILLLHNHINFLLYCYLIFNIFILIGYLQSFQEVRQKNLVFSLCGLYGGVVLCVLFAPAPATAPAPLPENMDDWRLTLSLCPLRSTLVHNYTYNL